MSAAMRFQVAVLALFTMMTGISQACDAGKPPACCLMPNMFPFKARTEIFWNVPAKVTFRNL